MEEQDKIPYISYKDAILKAKQLQKEEPKTYTQEEMDTIIGKAMHIGYFQGFSDLELFRNKKPKK